MYTLEELVPRIVPHSKEHFLSSSLPESLRVSSARGNVRRGVPGGAEIIAPAARASDVNEVDTSGEVSRLVSGLATDLGQLNEAADVGEHICSKAKSNINGCEF